MVVNTMGWVDGKGYDMILQAIQAFKIDVVLVMGHDRCVRVPLNMIIKLVMLYFQRSGSFK
jgi:polynucleotide 5'-kinase involved in rRNA processing